MAAVIYPPGYSLSPSSQHDSGGRTQKEKSLGLSEKQGDHLPLVIRCRTDLGKINLMYCQLKIELDGVKKNTKT